MTMTNEELEQRVIELAGQIARVEQTIEIRTSDTTTTVTVSDRLYQLRLQAEGLGHRIAKLEAPLASVASQAAPGGSVAYRLEVLQKEFEAFQRILAAPPSSMEERLIALEGCVSPRLIGRVDALEIDGGVAKKIFEKLLSTPGERSFNERLLAFFGPMIDGLNPPLDGAQVATKAFVDEGIARIARAIRGEMGVISTVRRDSIRKTASRGGATRKPAPKKTKAKKTSTGKRAR